jgi:hypothetical protein
MRDLFLGGFLDNGVSGLPLDIVPFGIVVFAHIND